MTNQRRAPVMALIRRAAGDGRRTAIFDPPHSVSYRDMLARIEVIRTNLVDLARPGGRVAVCLPRSAEQICAMLGVIDAGRVPVLLDPTNPKARLQAMLEDTEPDVVLVNQDSPAFDARWQTRLVSTSSFCNTFKRPLTSTQTAYIVFTSGSTGRPKGVQVGHEGLLEHTVASVSRFSLSSEDVTVQFASPGFDVIIEEVFPTLGAGGTLVIRPDALWTPDEFVDFLTEHRITNLELPSGYWAAMFWDDELRADLRPNPELRFINVGGEKTTRQAHAKWLDSAFRNVTLYNTYGPSEVIVTSNVWEVPADLPEGISDAVPLGPPLGNRTMHVLDPNDLEGPEVEIGELVIGGAIADGYVARPDETARRFIYLPSGERVYRTGDRVQRMDPGCFEFLGRLDDQVKVRGFRVELGEVEAVIRELPRVHGVAAALNHRRSGLVALVVLDRHGNLDEIVASAKAVLPEYMFPRIKSVAYLPNLPSGKLDRNAVAAAFA